MIRLIITCYREYRDSYPACSRFRAFLAALDEAFYVRVNR